MEVLCYRDDVVAWWFLCGVHNELEVLSLNVETGGTEQTLHVENGEVVPLSHLFKKII